MENFEIERKFLLDLDKVPYDFSKLTKKSIEQGYIIFKPEIRVRNVCDEEYFMTIKQETEDSLIRKEFELKISKSAYNKLMERDDVYKIKKNRYIVNENNVNYEIDIFDGDLSGLSCLEVEFRSKEDADNFSVPYWIKKEVTNDKRYRNSNLAKNSIPLEN